ncbi:MAG: hypothetical protein AAGU19_07975 [Prolixibacteraceae bacterium]
MTTIIECAEIINKEFAGCFAFVEGRDIEVTVRGKKSDKVYISNGEVRYKGNCATVAGQIAERFNLVKNF